MKKTNEINKTKQQFSKYPESFMRKYFSELNKYYFNDVYNLVLDLNFNLLIFNINEKRSQGLLLGSTPEQRYIYYNEILCDSGEILNEFEERYPEIIERTVLQINKYLLLHEEVKSNFINDFQELKKKNFISHSDTKVNESKIHISIEGDIHNGKGVSILTYDNQKIVYKNKSISSNKFLKKFTDFLRNHTKFDLTIIPDFICKNGYFWEKYIAHKELKTRDDAHFFYNQIGYILAIAYTLNITDLHYENLIAYGNSPFLIDVETIFGISVYKIESENNATKSIIEKNNSSILNTCLLPVSIGASVYGGDISGVLGGTFFGEVRKTKNYFRDDIHIVREKVKKEYFTHLPYFRKNGEKIFLDPQDYVKDIIKGFQEIESIILKHKNYIKKILLDWSTVVDVRLLFRNTKEYSVVRTLMLSPIYSKETKMMFNKLSSKFDNEKNDRVSPKEQQQLLNMDIPLFSIKASDFIIKADDEEIWSLSQSPIEAVIDKLKNLTVEVIELQKELIIFSFNSSQKIFSTDVMKSFEELNNYRIGKDVIVEGIKELVNSLIDKKEICLEDNSINWMTLGVGDYDVLELEPMNYSIYNGISGIALSLMDSYSFMDFKMKIEIEEILNFIHSTLLQNFEKIENLSLFNGRTGVVLTLQKIDKFLGKRPTVNLNEMLEKVCNEITLNHSIDLLEGIAGIVIILCRLKSMTVENKILLMKLKNIILESKIETEDYVYWGEKKNLNVSLAHGNLGIEIALLELYIVFGDFEIMRVFKKALAYEEKQKLNLGWYDNRNNSRSANWCHGSTGVLISRIEMLNLEKEHKLFTLKEKSDFYNQIDHALMDILDIGINMTNFSLCHGTSGNLIALASLNIDNEEIINNHFLLKHYSKMHEFGKKNGWMCSQGTNFDSLGLYTGISGIILSSTRYLKAKSISELLLD